jgi:cytochrome c-type biogenesis protein CcmH
MSGGRRSLRTWLPWLALVVVLAVALVAGTRRDGGPETVEGRVHRVAKEIRCPTCRSISAAESDAPASVAVRKEIERQVRDGRSDAEIRSFFVDRFGDDILLRPRASGVAAAVWALPVIALVCRATPGTATAEDRALVERALEGG